MSTLSLLLSLGPFKKFVVVGGWVGGGGWVVRVILVLSLSFKLNNSKRLIGFGTIEITLVYMLNIMRHIQD